MAEDLQETNSSGNKQTSFLSKSVDKKTLIIVICLAVCFLLVVLLFSFISSSRKSQAQQSFSRPSINAPRKAHKKDIEDVQIQDKQESKIQSDQTSQIESAPGYDRQRRFMERRRKMITQAKMQRGNIGRFRNETLEEEQERLLRQDAEGFDPSEDNYNRPKRRRSGGSKARKQSSSQKSQQTGSERPRLNS